MAYIDNVEQKFVIKLPWSGCWIWIGCISQRGYGNLSGGRYAHRVFYQAYKGDIPYGKMVCHSCDVRCCVNPDHLFTASHRENVLDAIVKDRYKRGFGPTHCHRGHEFSEENTYHYKGHRHCKTCWKLRT